MIHSFYDDYSEGAHPEIIKAISQNNDVQQFGYSKDDYCLEASSRIKKAFGLSNADVHFLPGGTSANVVGLLSMLKPFEGVISADTGHINVHEAGALEATGQKIISFPNSDGKLPPQDISKAIENYEGEHTVRPKVVYISQTTESGTVYSKKELEEIVSVAKANNLYTFLDGARLAMSFDTIDSPSIVDVGNMGFDMFYIGGTKNGGIFGEAIVIDNDELKLDFRSYMKRQGALIAKGRFMGQQFMRFFDVDNLWLRLGKQANETAQYFYNQLKDLGVEFESECESNQLFPTFDNETIEKLETEFGFYRWKKIDQNYTQIRLVCSWATPKEAIDKFIGVLDKNI